MIEDAHTGRFGVARCRRIWQIILLVSIVTILLGACHNIFSALPIRWGDSYQGNSSILLDPEEVCEFSTPGISTPSDIKDRFGAEYRVDFSYDPAYPMSIDGRHFPIDRLIVYDGVSIHVDQGAGVTSYTNRGWRVIAFFFYKSRLLHFTIAEQFQKPDGTYEWGPYSSKAIMQKDGNEKWPDSRCMSAYYDKLVLELPPDEIIDPGKDCSFSATGFEDQLRKEGYYNKLDGDFKVPMGPDECPGPK